MAKEWILNSATNRFQMNFSRNVGKVSEEIRKCSPRTVDDWEQYYYHNVRSKEHLTELGKKLYIKISETLQAEINSVTEEDCTNFIINLVINRTFDGYNTEKVTIYEQLQEILGVKIEPAPDEWDRSYNVDFFIKLNDKYIGIQIKPASGVSHIPQIYQERTQQSITHGVFTSKFGGKVFYVISMKVGDKKTIHNIEVIAEIQDEIKRLSQ
jgi:hypothetical protein